MERIRFLLPPALLLLLIGIMAVTFSGDISPSAVPVERISKGCSSDSRHAKALETYSEVALGFEANQGQTENQVEFLSRGRGYGLFLTASEAVLVFTKPRGKQSAVSHQREPKPKGREETAAVAVVRMKFLGANPAPRMLGLERLPRTVGYFNGNNPRKWRTNIPVYTKVKYEDIYPGVDLVYYRSQKQLEYDFIVAPGADPKAIWLGFEGADKLEIDRLGDLIIHAGGGKIRQHKPIIYQERDGVRQEISGGYVLKDNRQIGFQVAAHDAAKPLVIDPQLVYSTYLGGSRDDFGGGIAVDSAGNAYLTGWTDSVDFPTTPGSFQRSRRRGSSAFITKVDPRGNIVYSTYLGGSGNEFEVVAIAVDSFGNAYVTGFTDSTNFPTTPGAVQTSNRGGADIFVTKLNPTGSALVYSTYLGGSSSDGSQSIAVDSAGNAYLTGLTESRDFPTTPGAFQASLGGDADAYAIKLNPTGSALVYSTYLGGSKREFGPAIAVDSAGNAYLTGLTESRDFPTTPGAFQASLGGDTDAYVTKLNPAGSDLIYSTYLGGSGFDEGRDVAADASGNTYVTGITGSTDFPTTPGAFQTLHRGGCDAFLTKFNPEGSALVYSTYLGGSNNDITRRMAIDASGNAYIAGGTYSPDFPTTGDAFQPSHGGGEDAFVTKISPEGTRLTYSTFLGGSGNDRARGIAADASGNIYVTGFTSSDDFPTASPIQAASRGGSRSCLFIGGGCDVFIAKIAIGK